MEIMKIFLGHKPLKKVFLIISIALLCNQHSFSQNSITGPTCVYAGVQYSYVLYAFYSGTSTFHYSISGGTLSTGDNNGNSSGPGSETILVTWTTTGSITLTSPAGNLTYNVTVAPTFTTGNITSGGAQLINYNVTPAPINCS